MPSTDSSFPLVVERIASKDFSSTEYLSLLTAGNDIGCAIESISIPRKIILVVGNKVLDAARGIRS